METTNNSILLICLLINAFLALNVNGLSLGGAALNATYQSCSNEGHEVQVALVANNPCIQCMCKDGLVQCRREKCPNMKSCYLSPPTRKSSKCCEFCKGCWFDGHRYKDGADWLSMSDPCQRLTCNEGIISKSKVNCYTPCDDPLPPRSGECCPRCPGCFYRGKHIEEGSRNIDSSDPCLQCECQKGNLTCSRISCPVLPCPASKTILKPGNCCPECQGSSKVSVPRGSCLVYDKVFKSESGKIFQPDPCTNCSCVNGTSVCQRQVCPQAPDCSGITLNRSAKDDNSPERRCCPKCRIRLTTNAMARTMAALPATRSLTCSYRGTTYQDGVTWSMDPCTKCICSSGEVRCSVQQCPVYQKKNSSNGSPRICPPGFHPVKEPGQCCPKCVEDDAVCTVFGDPHYRTFDGRVFSYQGACKYLLTSDCKNKTFSVRVINDARSSRSFSWTKTVILQIEDLRVTLGQHMKVKVNKKRVSLPFVSLGTLSIVQEGYSVLVRTNIGVKLLWDGDSFLEVTVPPSWKEKLCGLCGNYNGIRQDDLRMRNGKLTRSVRQFAASWKIGGSKICSRTDAPFNSSDARNSITHESRSEPLCKQDWDVRIRAVRECNALKASVYSKCHKRVSPVRFFKSCLVDMCECPGDKPCYCEALTAYAHECERNNVSIDPKWRTLTSCAGHRYHP